MLTLARLALRGARFLGAAVSPAPDAPSHLNRPSPPFTSGFRLAWIVSAIAAAHLSAELHAATYYIASWGSDSNSGTSSSAPLKSYGIAAYKMVGGDMLNVLSGNHAYTTPQYFYKSGTSSARITIQSIPGGWATLYGDYLTPNNNEGILTLSGDFITIKNMAFKRSKQIGVRFWSSSNCVIDGVVAEYNQTCGIAMDGDYNASSGNAGRSKNANNTIKNCSVGYNVQVNKSGTLTSATGWPAALAFYLGKDSTIQNVSSYNNYGEGIIVNNSTNTVVDNCRATNNHSVNIYFDNSYNCRVKYCTVDGQVWGGQIFNGIANSAENYGFFEQSPSSNVFENNTIKNARYGLIWVGQNGYGNGETHWAERCATSGWSWGNTFTGCTTNITVGVGNSGIDAR
jgi:hypothetical protein